MKAPNMDNFKIVSLDKLIQADWNYKIEDEELMEKLKNNIKKNGFIENIIVRELENGKCEVVNGNHRLRALQELGFEKVLVYNLGLVSIEEAKRVAIETNEIKWETDLFKLSEILQELSDSFDFEDLKMTLPFSEIELENLIKLENVFEPDEIKEEELLNEEQKISVKCKISVVEKDEFLEALENLKAQFLSLEIN